MNQGRIAAVTGASSGIGRATALELARRGYDVFALARSEEQLRQLSYESHGRAGSITPVVMDIADDRSREGAIQRIMDATSGYGVDVLVNSAGFGQMGPMEEVTAHRLRRQLEVNVVGLLAFTQPFLAGMRARRYGYVVNLSSVAGRLSTPFMGAYNTSKFALEGMSDALRLELAAFGVHVILIEPGPVPTEFGRVANAGAVVDPGSVYERYYQRFRMTHGVAGRFARSPETVARVIARAVGAANPRARYTITLPAKLSVIGRLLPDRLRDWGYRLALGLRP